MCWIVVVLAACGGTPHAFKPPAVMPTAKQVVDQLAKERELRRSVRVQTMMDYWLGKQRVKGKVRVMGTAKRQVRFNAIKPDETVLVDMACNGADFTYVDFQNNCQLSGPCDQSSIASLLRVELEPDDFHAFAQGVPPVIAGDGTVTWDSSKGYERVNLTGAGGTQTIVIDARDQRMDVISSERRDPGGKIVWSVENSGFHVVKDVTGASHRVPGKTRFKNPRQEADLLVDWLDDERAINLEIDASKFTVPIPAGLPSCGGASPPPAP
jgi:hypothetical protein